MTPEITYITFLQKVNKGSSNFNITCDKAQFALLINESKNRWVEKHLKDKDSVLIESLQEIIKTKDYLTGVDKGTYIEYTLEDDFYESISTSSEVERNNCKSVVYSRPIKNQNKNINQFDENLKPDFEFEWSFYTIQSNSLKLYKTDFKVNKTTFEYYAVIPEFDIEGYVKIDNTASTNKPLPLSDQYVNQIVNVAAEEFMRNYENQIGLQIAKDRTNNQE